MKNYKLQIIPRSEASGSRSQSDLRTNYKSPDRGIVLLMVLLILSSLLSISIGIFNLTIGEIRASGEITDSFVAFYAADEGIEKTLYLDRVSQNIVCVNAQGNPVNGQDCYVDNQILQNQSGFNIKVSKTPNKIEIKAIGQYQCPGTVGSGMCGIDTFRVVKRGFSVTY